MFWSPHRAPLVVVDECHHVPAAAFEHAVRQIPARRWLGLTATPYRRDQLDDLIALHVGPVRHMIDAIPSGTLDGTATEAVPEPVLIVHPTAFRYSGAADPSAPGGIAAVYRDLVADETRTRQVAADVTAALERGRTCLVLTQWTGHVDRWPTPCVRLGAIPRLVQYTGRILRCYPGKATAEVHDYHDVATGVLASSLARRAPGYTSLGFPEPRRSPGR